MKLISTVLWAMSVAILFLCVLITFMVFIAHSSLVSAAELAVPVYESSPLLQDRSGYIEVEPYVQPPYKGEGNGSIPSLIRPYLFTQYKWPNRIDYYAEHMDALMYDACLWGLGAIGKWYCESYKPIGIMSDANTHSINDPVEMHKD